MTVDILEFIKEQFKTLFDFMRDTVVFEPSVFLFDFPVTIWDLCVGLFTLSTILYFFGFANDYDDSEVGD